MENIIKINNKNLANYIMFKLDKIDNEFSQQELNQITEIVIDYNDEQESCFIFLKELIKLNNLKSITLRNGYIFNDNYNVFFKLPYLSEFVFEKCGFENVNFISSLKIKSLSLINCNIDNYDFLNIFSSLEELTIINGKVEIQKINMIKDLKYLQLSYSTIDDNSELNIKGLQELYIDNTNVINFNFLNNLSNLKKLSIDKNQYSYNKNLFNFLINNNLTLLNENMVEFWG